MSGGMRQRAMIAMAVSCHPSLVIADEPTTALDVTIQAQILDLMGRLKEQIDTSIILITHNLGIIAENAQEVAVMYAGKVVEYASTKVLFRRPLHPYTNGLMKCIPKLKTTELSAERLAVIPGIVPNLYDLPMGCSFAERCQEARNACREGEPQLIPVDEGHLVRCLKY
jgi:oligopeptide/dipeptide ABC transporter ATP-binding protein